MKEQDILNNIDKMIDLNKNIDNDEVWMSPDIFINLTAKEYKGYTLHTSNLMPEDYMIIGKMYY
tara:strand:- start:229 stop:420 length:192 start_codon:yes stop_codon:yes gene_type:complete